MTSISISRLGRPRGAAMAATAVFACVLMLGLAGCASRAGTACDPCDPCAEPVACDPCDPCPDERPPEAKPGEAWCRIWIPPVTETVTETVCIAPACKKKVVVPAEYGVRPKLVCVAPAQLREVVRPGVWTTRKKDVMVCPERDVYRRVCCPPGKLDPCERQGECWVKSKCPPVFRTECEPVCVAPPKKCVEFKPAQYECQEERYMIRPARCEEVITPAQYEERTREVCVQPGRWEWRRNVDCEVPEEALPALEVEMVDSDPDGREEGIFASGSTVRYNLTVRSDVGSEAMPNLKVVFTLPEQLEFLSGGGSGVTVTGSGQAATSSVFPLGLNQEVRLFILARVVSVPPTNFVQTTASVQTEAGDELARETESTSLTEKSGG
jgi:hypothetical protein